MWMTEYIAAVKRGLRDAYPDTFTLLPGSTEREPLLDGPDGAYPVTVDGRLDSVRIENGKIFCCNFDR